MLLLKCIKGVRGKDRERERKDTLMTPLKGANLVPQIQQQYHPLGPPDVNTTLNKKENITKNFFKYFILFLLKSNFEKGNFG